MSKTDADGGSSCRVPFLTPFQGGGSGDDVDEAVLPLLMGAQDVLVLGSWRGRLISLNESIPGPSVTTPMVNTLHESTTCSLIYHAVAAHSRWY